MEELEQHQLGAILPALAEDQISELAQDILAYGQLEPGTLLDGQVLDGWHRYLACKKVGIEFRANEYQGIDPAAYVWSKILGRNLSQSQLAGIKVKLSEWRPQGRVSNSAAAAQLPSAAKMAEEAGVSTRTIVQAKKAERFGLGDAVVSGKISAEQAAEFAKLPGPQLEEAKRAIERGDKPAIQKPEKVQKQDPKDAEILFLRGRVETLEEQNTDLAETAKELEDKLALAQATEPDEQQQLIASLQKKAIGLEAEISRLRIDRQGLQNKINELVREVKRLRKDS